MQDSFRKVKDLTLEISTFPKGRRNSVTPNSGSILKKYSSRRKLR